jgi:hypothetical protein|tara:strand:- start:885 stop:1295 length:411 start_codon:yes stop_codon:yes gene_type:complete
MGPKERLNIYLSNLSDEPFHWGVNDCFTFTNGAFRAMYGFGYADDWMGRYMNGASPKNATSMRREFKHSTLFCGLASKLVRSEQPVFGSLVTTRKSQRWVTGAALGISIGSRAVFLSKDGLIRLNVEDVESSWVPK